MLKRLDLDLDLQTKSKVTRQKRRPIEPTEKTPSIIIVKGEEGRPRSSLLLKRASLIYIFFFGRL